MIEFEKNLYEQVEELEQLLGNAVYGEVHRKSKRLFNSIKASIMEQKKELDAHIDVELEEMQSLVKSSKKLAK